MEPLRRAKWYGAALLALAAGALLPWWPLCALAVLVLILGQQEASGIALALMLDIAYGPPPGLLQYAVFPFTLCALALMALTRWGGAVFFDRRSSERL
jgi:hypothetical protein